MGSRSKSRQSNPLVLQLCSIHFFPISEPRIAPRPPPIGPPNPSRRFQEPIQIPNASWTLVRAPSFSTECPKAGPSAARGSRRPSSKDEKKRLANTDLGKKDFREKRELLWESEFDSILARIGKTRRDIENEPKSAAWRVSAAAILKKPQLCENPWEPTPPSADSSEKCSPERGKKLQRPSKRRTQRKRADPLRNPLDPLRNLPPA